MRNPLQKFAITTALMIVAAGIPALYAQDSQRSPGSMMERGLNGHGGTMMGQRGGMGSCMGMMQGGGDSDRPNDQWRKPAPSNPDQKS
jgi:hypothetical protein